jgi:hypothetical protein
MHCLHMHLCDYIMTETSHCFWKCARNSSCRLSVENVCLRFLVDCHPHNYTHHWKLMKSVGSLMAPSQCYNDAGDGLTLCD